MFNVYADGVDVQLEQDIKEAVSFFLNTLLEPQEKSQVTVFVKFVDKKTLPKNVVAITTWVDDYINPTEFSIQLVQGQSRVSIFKSIAHECVHVKQMFRGELVCETFDKVMFMKKSYDLDLDYMSQPWEEEAFLMEASLYYDYKAMHKALL
jgi:hypothetical protein